MFYDNWRVQRTILWTSFLGSFAVGGILYAIFLLFFNPEKGILLAFFGVLLAFLSLAVGSAVASKREKKIKKKYPLFFLNYGQWLVYIIPPKIENSEKICLFETEWKVLPKEVVFGQLKIKLGSFDQTEEITVSCAPFANVKFKIDLCFDFELVENVSLSGLILNYKDYAGLIEYLKKAGELALQAAAKKLFHVNNGLVGINDQLTPPVSELFELNLANIFNKEIRKKISSGNGRHFVKLNYKQCWLGNFYPD